RRVFQGRAQLRQTLARVPKGLLDLSLLNSAQPAFDVAVHKVFDFLEGSAALRRQLQPGAEPPQRELDFPLALPIVNASFAVALEQPLHKSNRRIDRLQHGPTPPMSLFHAAMVRGNS